ncbi:hypothetical protein FRC16_006242 [Serendipita sp. 398]|nr:hypothetical protein FRC16_006242 [Serendipita sp. 398]
MIGEVSSAGQNGKDNHRMLLEAACLARVGNANKPEGDPVVVPAIYITDNYFVKWQLVTQPDRSNPTVYYTAEIFNLSQVDHALDFVFRLYNLLDEVKHQSEMFLDLFKAPMRVYRPLTGLPPPSGPPSGGTKGRGSAPGTKKRKWDDQEHSREDSYETNTAAIIRSGLTLISDNDAGPLLPPSGKLLKARARNKSLVILKHLGRRHHESDILSYLKERNGAEHHVIPLLNTIQLDLGRMIVLPMYHPLPDVLPSISNNSVKSSLQKQLVEGVSFIHQYRVAHLDLKPDNIVINRKKPELPLLYIIDFGSSMRLTSLEMQITGIYGTPEWMAPEVSDKVMYSPVLADRWSCGRLIRHIDPSGTSDPYMAELSKNLMKHPSSRPPLDQALAQYSLGSQSSKRNTGGRPIRTSTRTAVVPPVGNCAPGGRSATLRSNIKKFTNLH